MKSNVDPQNAEHKAHAALTDAAVRKYKPTKARRRIRDTTKGLFLVIEPSGTKSWQMRFRVPGGRIGKLTLGRFDFSGRELEGDPEIGQPLTVAAARMLAAKVHRDRERGLDVIADNKARKHRQRTELEEREANTFGPAARGFINEHAKKRTRRWFETARLLGLDHEDDELKDIPGGLAQRWADKPISDIDDHDIWSVVEEARRTSVPGIKPRRRGVSEARPRALLAALSTMFGWLHEKRKIGRNPCTGLARPEAPEARDRVLSKTEIAWLWRACDSIDASPFGQPPFGKIFKLLLLTGQRLREVGGMRRDELDGSMWSIPKTRTKNRRPHQVPLPPLAQKLIGTPSNDFAFSTTGKTPVSGWSRAKKRLDAAMAKIAKAEGGKDAKIAPWRLHDLRRTTVTGMIELGIAPHVVELIVNHVSGVKAGVAGIYNKAEMMPERKEALERWATHVQGLVSGASAKVVDLKQRKQK